MLSNKNSNFKKSVKFVFCVLIIISIRLIFKVYDDLLLVVRENDDIYSFNVIFHTSDNDLNISDKSLPKTIINITENNGEEINKSYYNNGFKNKLKEFNFTDKNVDEYGNLSNIFTLRHFLRYKNEYKKAFSWARIVSHYKQDTPFCNTTLNKLAAREVIRDDVNETWVRKNIEHVQVGGFHSPVECRARHKIAVLVPYRNRARNLAIFLRNIHPFLQMQHLEYRIFVIEQSGNDKFNKGILFNAGFMISELVGNWSSLVFNDVDLIPMDLRVFYACPLKPTHMSAAVEQFGYKVQDHHFGGVTCMSQKHFLQVNGYSNLYFNWGGEDNDMFIRLQASRLPVLRYDRRVARFAALTHKPQPQNPERWRILRRTKTRFRREGLNTVRFKLLEFSLQPLYTHLLIALNPPSNDTTPYPVK